MRGAGKPIMEAYDVIQICQTIDGLTTINCRLIPAAGVISGNPTLQDMMPVILSCIGLMALAWSIKRVLKLIER